VRNPRQLPELTVTAILAWADAHHARTGRWPTRQSGPIPEAPGETWETVAGALLKGTRTLSGGSSLADLLAQNRGKRNHMDLPRLRVVTILAWADAHWARTGNWPTEKCGPVIDAPGEKWSAVDIALEHGSRGLPGGSSLPRLLAKHRGVRNPSDLPHLRVATILRWADAHHARTGQWPKPKSGPIRESPDDTWYRVHTALIEGLRGLPGGSSLPRLLAAERGVRNRLRLPKFRVTQIVQWAIEHHERTGTWPRRDSGPIASAPGETWSAVANALTQGGRGLSGGSSLPRVLDELAGRKNAVPIAR
jgi:hypothetical protein